MFDCYFKESMIKRAQDKKSVKINLYNFRDFAKSKHKNVDDRPYGGGPGMIFKVEPIYRCLKNIQRKKSASWQTKIILLSPQGKTFNQEMAKKFSKLNQLILICGRYEGFDERVKKFVDEEISIGNYVLTGGELPAMVIVDTVARLVPGVLGKAESLLEETFCKKGYVEYPQYTRPEMFKGLKVPKVLLSGDHQKVKKWRKRHERNEQHMHN
jgi:tRNA (guanine37-N1)-methyltransferase